MQALICSNNAGVYRASTQRPPLLKVGARRTVHALDVVVSSADAETKIPRALASLGVDPATVQVSELTTVVLAAVSGNRQFYVLDSDHNPKNNLPQMAGIWELRQRCRVFGLELVRITNASQVDDVLRPLLQRAGYNLQRGAGVPLGMDYNRRNTYEALDDASVGVGQIFQDLHSQRGYTGDHKSDQTGEKQNLAGFGWGTTARGKQNVGIEDWGFQRTWQQYCSRTRTTNRSIFMSVYCLGNTAFA